MLAPAIDVSLREKQLLFLSMAESNLPIEIDEDASDIEMEDVLAEEWIDSDIEEEVGEIV